MKNDKNHHTTFMVLMDRELAYEVSLQSLQRQKNGEIIYQNKKNGLMLLKKDVNELKVSIKNLTKHTAKITITSTPNYHITQNIISHIKHKERLFLHY